MKTLTSLADSFGIFAKTYKYLQKSKMPGARLEDLKMQWAQDLLLKFNVELEVSGEISNEPSVLFVGNHISYIDIPLLMSVVRGLSFVAKDEVSKWPIIGPGAKRVDTVFVKRESGSSRRLAKQAIQQGLHAGQRIVVFPSATTCLFENKPWRKGAFEIAHEDHLKIQPFRLTYSPLRETAYIDDDFLPTHLFKVLGLDRIQARIEFHKPVSVTDPIADCEYWQNWSRELIDLGVE